MNDFIRDPELDQLVAELNQRERAPNNVSPVEPTQTEVGTGVPPVFRIDGQLTVAEDEVLDADDVTQIFAPYAGRPRCASRNSSSSFFGTGRGATVLVCLQPACPATFGQPS